MENCTHRNLVILASCLVLLLSIVQETSQDKQVTYLLGRPAENCTLVCASRGMSCIEIGAFPNNALSIFHSINVTCTTSEELSGYGYPDSPNYIISGDWEGQCIGFKGLNETAHSTLCGIGYNPAVRRLCPCGEQIFVGPTPSPKPTSSREMSAKATTPADDQSTTQTNNTISSIPTPPYTLPLPTTHITIENMGTLRTAGPLTLLSTVLWIAQSN
ncbi:uncharacterized protein LOC116308951 [Actinia tenebrosa]|uniref:Uncharacterized protein LOC116308951 n=1 Tax=Actinia tenebrosa TaxID=6105 RepID=A0A6P8J6C5_ACTTE|nr:uncharacterized protein LOC116308951 [Actinia tenebrosa]